MFHRKPTDPIYTPDIGPPQGEGPDPAIYAKMGEAAIFAMMEDFYAELGKSSIAPMFPKDLQKASKKSAAFFVFLLGGPPLYHQQFGPPMMRKRHLPFRITEEHRKVWVGCFRTILRDPARYGFPEEHLEGFFAFLERFSAWMVNTKLENSPS